MVPQPKLVISPETTNLSSGYSYGGNLPRGLASTIPRNVWVQLTSVNPIADQRKHFVHQLQWAALGIDASHIMQPGAMDGNRDGGMQQMSQPNATSMWLGVRFFVCLSGQSQTLNT